MFNWATVLGFLIVTSCALLLVSWPLRHRRMVGWVAPLLCCIAGFGYWYWGSWHAQADYTQHKLREKEAETFLETLKTPKVLIDKLQHHLQKHPRSAKGWYLLGRMYASQHEWEKAHQAFASAYQLNSDDELIAVNYAQSLLGKHSQSDEDQAREILKKLLERDPQQPDALMLLAVDAERHQNKPEALKYWRKLLLLIPDSSPEAASIRKKIQELQT